MRGQTLPNYNLILIPATTLFLVASIVVGAVDFWSKIDPNPILLEAVKV